MYRLWRPNTKTVIKATDVRFIEKIKDNNKVMNKILQSPLDNAQTSKEDGNIPFLKESKNVQQYIYEEVNLKNENEENVKTEKVEDNVFERQDKSEMEVKLNQFDIS